MKKKNEPQTQCQPDRVVRLEAESEASLCCLKITWAEPKAPRRPPMVVQYKKPQVKGASGVRIK